MIDNATVDRIFAAANVVEVVSDFVTLRKKGINYQACCPFHNEKTPSFVVSPAKGLFKCFGCGKGGNSVTFVMEHEGMSYVDALKYVAKKYGIEVQERELSPDESRRNDNRESMMVVSSYAADYFVEQLHKSQEGLNVGISYFRERGFSDSTIEKFRLGYCPASGDTFTSAALEAGYQEEFLVGTGLSGKKENGRFYDRFFGRVIFPIHSISGRVTGFGGRTLRTDKKVSKYLNSPESEIYHKSQILYGLFFAKKAITQDDNCILVEGYTDVISMHQSGVENVVSSSGTSLTTEQIRLISRFTRNVTVIYDADAAGIKASLRGIDMILREGLNVRVVLMPDGEDPDSFARSHNATQLREFIKSAEEDFISFKTRLLMSDAAGDPIKKAGLITDIVQSIAEIPDPIMRSLYIKECSRTMDVEVQLLTSEVARKRISHDSDSQTKEFMRNQQWRNQQQRSGSDLPPEGLFLPEGDQGASVFLGDKSAGSSIEELEKELVKYLLKFGNSNFDYKEGHTMVSLNVAEIIISDLQNNGIIFQNASYRAIYESYVGLFENMKLSGEKGEIAIHNFVNHPDPAVCNAVVDILTAGENYKMSRLWLKFDVIDESEQDRLSETVPRIIILYKSKAIEVIINSLQRQLCDETLPEEDVFEITYRIAALNKERMTISKKLSRLIL